MLECAECSYDKITSRDNIYNFTKELVKRIDMKAMIVNQQSLDQLG